MSKDNQIIPYSFEIIKNEKNNLIVNVNDIITTRDDLEEIDRLNKNLAREFEIKDLRQMRYLLSREVARLKGGISVSQQKYPH